MKDWYLIGEFSKKTQLSVKALRHYQEIDLLTPHSRGDNQYRYYTESQVAEAQRIREYKDLGFSLDEIKMLLPAHQDASLIALLEKRLSGIECSQDLLATQKKSIVSILTSLNKGLELSNTQRSFIMESLLESGIAGLKRRGIVPNPVMLQQLQNEVKHLTPKQEQVVGALREITKFAREKNILMGPGRGSSGASLVLFSEGYSPINPLKFNLMPELFAGSKFLWLDFEFSRAKEVGELCRSLATSLDFELVAFKSPLLDIFHRVQKKVGTINFDSIPDDGEAVLSAFKKKDLRGIWNFEWNPNFTANLRASKEIQDKYARDQGVFESWLPDYELSDASDIINVGYIFEMLGIEKLNLYKSLKDKKVLYPFLKPTSQEFLKTTHGMLLYREDWIRILCDYLDVDIFEAIEIFRAVAKDHVDTCEYKKFLEISDDSTKELLLDASKTVFLKAHMVQNYWYIKRTAILKTLWPEVYLKTIDTWEKENGIIWQEFGYVDKGERIFEA